MEREQEKEGMMNITYGFGITINVPYEEALQLVREALKSDERTL